MNNPSPSILLIYTGGTIGMIENPETGALENFHWEQFQQHVPELKRFNFHIDSIMFGPPIDSSDMEPKYWVRIAQIISKEYDRYDAARDNMQREAEKAMINAIKAHGNVEDL